MIIYIYNILYYIYILYPHLQWRFIDLQIFASLFVIKMCTKILLYKIQFLL